MAIITTRQPLALESLPAACAGICDPSYKKIIITIPGRRGGRGGLTRTTPLYSKLETILGLLNLRIPIPEPQNPGTPESRNLGISGSRDLGISESRDPGIPNSRNLCNPGIPGSRNLGTSEPRNLGTSESRNPGNPESRRPGISESRFRKHGNTDLRRI